MPKWVVIGILKQTIFSPHTNRVWLIILVAVFTCLNQPRHKKWLEINKLSNVHVQAMLNIRNIQSSTEGHPLL